MLELLERCYPSEIKTDAWQQKLRSMIPSYGSQLSKNPEMLAQVREHSHKVLGLVNIDIK